MPAIDKSNPMFQIIKVLAGHNSPETAYVINDYPYGFNLRCSMRIWIETRSKMGQRVMSQTTNPKKGDSWNKPKAGTYTQLKSLYIDGNGHVQNQGIGIYSDFKEVLEFEKNFLSANAEDEYFVKALQYMKSYACLQRLSSVNRYFDSIGSALRAIPKTMISFLEENPNAIDEEIIQHIISNPLNIPVVIG